VKQHLRGLKKRAEAAAAETGKGVEGTEGASDVPATPKPTPIKGTRKKAAAKPKDADDNKDGEAVPKRKRGRPAVAKPKVVPEDNKENEDEEPESPTKIAKTDAASAVEEV
jgi:hypothetical protein